MTPARAERLQYAAASYAVTQLPYGGDPATWRAGRPAWVPSAPRSAPRSSPLSLG